MVFPETPGTPPIWPQLNLWARLMKRILIAVNPGDSLPRIRIHRFLNALGHPFSMLKYS